MIDSNETVLLAVGHFAMEFLAWGEGSFCRVFPGARVHYAKTVDEAITEGWHVKADILFLPPTIDGLQDLIHEFVRLGKDARQIVFCGKDEEGGATGSLVAAMNAAQPRGAIYMQYGRSAIPMNSLKFVRAQVTDLLDRGESVEGRDASAK